MPQGDMTVHDRGTQLCRTQDLPEHPTSALARMCLLMIMTGRFPKASRLSDAQAATAPHVGQFSLQMRRSEAVATSIGHILALHMLPNPPHRRRRRLARLARPPRLSRWPADQTTARASEIPAGSDGTDRHRHVSQPVLKDGASHAHASLGAHVFYAHLFGFLDLLVRHQQLPDPVELLRVLQADSRASGW